MAIARRLTTQSIPVGILILALLSAVVPLGHNSTSTSLQSNSLLFTVKPDRSVDVNWNKTTTVPLAGNFSGFLLGSYKVHASSNFTQQSNSVVETTVVQYQLPSTLAALVNSISLTATQSGLTGSGHLTINANLPLQNLDIKYSTSPSQIQVNATAQLQLQCYLLCTGPFANQTSFKQSWAKTIGNATWINRIESQIQNATRQNLTVLISATETDYPSSAAVSLRFVATPSGSAADFVMTLANFLSMTGMPGIIGIIQSILSLETGSSTTLNYSSSTGKLVVQTTTNYVSDLDSQLNTLKLQYFQILIAPFRRSGLAIPSQLLFLNSTSITVSKISTTTNLDLSTGMSSTALNGLIITPPTAGTSTNFTIPGLFQTLGSLSFSSHPLNITLAGGSDSNNQVKVVVPPGTAPPNSTTSNSATWTNVRNATELKNVEFQLQPIAPSLFAILTSPTGITIEAIVAAAVLAGVFLLLRKRRSTTPVPSTNAGPASTPRLGPGPVVPPQ